MSTYVTTKTNCQSFWPAFYGNISEVTLNNTAYRKILSTTPNMQLAVMSLMAGQEIGLEVHPYTTQYIKIESGVGVAYIEDKSYQLSNDVAIIVPPGAKHNIVNTSTDKHLKLYTIYSPPEHDQDLTELYKS